MKLSFKKLGTIFTNGFWIVLLLSAFAIAGSQSDTTYGNYRVKEKEHRRKADNPDHQNNRNADEKNDGLGSACLSSCSEGCFNLGIEILADLFKGIGSSIVEGSSTSSHAGEFSQFSQSKFRFGLGLGAGISNYPRIATGFQPEVITHFYIIPSSYLCFRAATGVGFSIHSVYADFEHDVLVNNVKIGTETFQPESYWNMSIPLSVEVMISPWGDVGSFHLIAGTGRMGVNEYIKGVRTTTSKDQIKEEIDSGFRMQNFVSFGIGWLLVLDERLGNLEIKYTASFLKNRHIQPFPGDNASYSNLCCLSYTGIF